MLIPSSIFSVPRTAIRLLRWFLRLTPGYGVTYAIVSPASSVNANGGLFGREEKTCTRYPVADPATGPNGVWIGALASAVLALVGAFRCVVRHDAC